MPGPTSKRQKRQRRVRELRTVADPALERASHEQEAQADKEVKRAQAGFANLLKAVVAKSGLAYTDLPDELACSRKPRGVATAILPAYEIDAHNR